MWHCIELTILFQKIKKWFYNHKDNPKKTVVIEVPVPTRPRATTARDCFADAFNEEIKEKVKVEREMTGALTQENLVLYRRFRDEMFDAADDETRKKFEEEALTFNSKIHEHPDRSEIYSYGLCTFSMHNELIISRSQRDVATNTVVSLKKLCGWNWGGHGDVVFFVLGAYRGQDSEISPFWYVSIFCSFVII